MWEIAKKICNEDPPLPSSINKTISPLFDAVVNKALAKKVENRYQTAHYLSRAGRMFSEEEQAEIVTLVARDPSCGDVIPGTGGLRKMRVPVMGRGKRGGARVIYFLYNDGMPVFLLTVFAKNERSDLSAVERGQLAKLAENLVKIYLE